MKKLLTVITPFYASNRSSYLNDRVELFIKESFYPEWMERIIIDFGSPEIISKKISSLCKQHGYVYRNLKKGKQKFSVGKCRNYGAQIAETEYITFADVDLYTDILTYHKIYQKILKNDLYNYFEVIPCLYLTEKASEKFINGEIKYNEIYDSYISNNSSVIKTVAPATSCFLLKRDFYLAEGGTREDFYGHGYEDFELLNRLADKSNKFYRPHDYYSHEFSYDSTEYKGYRTYFSLFGRENLSKEIYYIHLHHEPSKDDGYKESSRRNKKIFENYLVSFDKDSDSPPALEHIDMLRHTLVIGHKNSLPFKGIREIIPLLGRITYRHEDDFSSPDEFATYVVCNKVDKIFFLNPYGNQSRLNLYERCKADELNYIVFDRGALPGSWFFDTKGFNADSDSYSAIKWRVDLNEEEEHLAESYINELCTSDKTLENNGERMGEYFLRKKYLIGNKKILFVPMQRPDDTVIKYFSDGVSSIKDFITRIKILAATLPDDWVICIKQHPLENYDLKIPGSIVVDSKTHIHDLVESCSAVLLINSGVGLISLCFDKPVFCFGKSFYSETGLAKKISPDDDLLEIIVNYEKFTPNTGDVRKFIYYLVFSFYSFAETDFKVTEPDINGASKSVAVSLAFSSIKIKGVTNLTLQRNQTKYPTNSPAYDYYRAYFLNEKQLLQPLANQKITQALNESSFDSQNSKYLVKKKMLKLIYNPRLFIKDAIKNKFSL